MAFTSNDLVPLTINVPRTFVPCVREALKLVRPEEKEVFGQDPMKIIQAEATCVLNLIFSVVPVPDWPKFEALMESYGLRDESEALEGSTTGGVKA
jgi:hypothetical protein